MTPPSFYVNTEGHKLGRSGTLDLLEIHVLPLWETFIVDVFTLKHAAFDTSFGGNSLRVLLQSPSVSKVFFDVRNDSDALFSHYKIILDGVVDLQLMEFFRGGRTGLSLRSLKRCIQRDGGLNSDQFRQWAQVKGEVDHSSREAGLDDLPLHKRPLLANLLLYATGDVVHLPLLYRAYRQKLSKQAWGQVQSETEKGLRQSRQPEYDPHARGKERGLARLPIHGNALNIATDGPGEANATLDQPEVKRPRNKSTLKPQLASHQRKPARPAVRNMEINSSFSIMARLHTLSLAVDPCESSAQASEVSEIATHL
ncbi:hypothetical protein A1O7_02992 [Cladophialophora yegresii CBS 114405]|uniref:3'-5' exonuclease domain-containing protein n=1 Tax=Cladophialophora yegresii CBS 114405 TaxID=1182544 RepID=W9WW82_9EURO|nr:uncharacterized protein A1O7_02992 [Cladophialophora yegresii CBS 114405]EXJ62554.1 hypothetical protein A1O7_02992 [Cladophialophora yegresii CBS 114405]